MRYAGRRRNVLRGVLGAAVAGAVVWAGGCSLGPNAQAATRPAASPVQQATQQVLASSRSNNEYLRANAIEAAQNLPDRVVPLVQLGVDDPAPVVRFTAVATIGKLRLATVAQDARRLLNDHDTSVRAAAIYALRACGQQVDLTPLAGMLASRDSRVRANVAMILGMMGDPSAVPMLKDMAHVPLSTTSQAQEAVERVQIAEAMFKLGDANALGVLRAACYSPYDDVRVLAVQAEGRAGDHKMERGMGVLLNAQPIELELAAAESLARLGKFDGQKVLLQGAASDLPLARAQAAMALPLFRAKETTDALEKLLGDPEEPVRLAAAAGVLQAAHMPAASAAR